jgi:exodeoxyribonuclease VII large subunit
LGVFWIMRRPRINYLLEPAINKQFWVKAEIATGRERGGSFYCDLG